MYHFIKKKISIRVYLICILIIGLHTKSISCDLSNRNKPVKVFILAGQSNAVGYNDIGELHTKPDNLDDLIGEHSPVLFWPGTNALPEFSGKWITLRPGVSEIAAEGAHKGGCFGPEIGFALSMYKAMPGDCVAVIKYAVGATGIARSKDYQDYIPGFEKFDDKDKNWSPSLKGEQAGLLYQNLMENIKIALDSLKKRGISYEISGFLWMQGEHEAGISKNMAQDYSVLLSQFRKSIRSDLHLEDLPFVVGEVNSHTWVFGDIARESQSKACREDKHTILVKTVDLPRGSVGGQAHFDAEGMMELGNRFARGMFKLLNKKDITGAFSQDNPGYVVQNILKDSKSGFPKNPVFPGWYADPEGIIFGKDFWIYPTWSGPFDEQLFFDAFSSRDLTSWTKHPQVLDTTCIKWAKKALWAPSVVEKDGKYFFFFGANNIQSNQEVGGIGVALADRPEGPFKDYLGKPLIDKIYNGAQPIDQFVFHDPSGQYYLIYGGWGHCNIVRLKSDFTGVEPFSDGVVYREITPENYVEGPFMFVRDGKYYFMWSEGNWTGPDYCVAYAVADNPCGPFKHIGKVLQQDPKIATGAGNHSVIRVPNSDRWYIVYHRRPLTETDGNSRETCIDRMYFDENGNIKPVVMTKEGVKPDKLPDVSNK